MDNPATDDDVPYDHPSEPHPLRNASVKADLAIVRHPVFAALARTLEKYVP